MLEIGLAIIALNLPSVWGLISELPVESILRSVRSIISLSSNTSHSNSRSYAELGGPPKMRKGSIPTSLNIELVPRTQREGFNTLHGAEQSSQHTELDLENGIMVQKSVDLTETRVGPKPV